MGLDVLRVLMTGDVSPIVVFLDLWPIVLTFFGGNRCHLIYYVFYLPVMANV